MDSGAVDGLHDLLPRIFCVVPPYEFVRSVAACCRRFSLTWYLSLFPCVVTVPDDVPSVNAAINRLAQDGSVYTQSIHDFGPSCGLVVIRPGRYLESVRVTRNCYILGLGRRADIVIEAPGWESALVFSGLGVRGFRSGEDACIANITFRCRNELMRGRCVYVVLGRPYLNHCDVDGGVLVSGFDVAPKLRRCSIQESWGSGLRLTDHCCGSLRDSVVKTNRRHGVLVDRGSCPDIMDNTISHNTVCGIRLFSGSLPLDTRSPPSSSVPLNGIVRNELHGNGQDDLSVTPRFADAEELHIDADEAGDSLGGCCRSEVTTEERGAEEDFSVFAPVGSEAIRW